MTEHGGEEVKERGRKEEERQRERGGVTREER